MFIIFWDYSSKCKPKVVNIEKDGKLEWLIMAEDIIKTVLYCWNFSIYKCKNIIFCNFRKTQNVLHVTLQRERVSAVKLQNERKAQSHLLEKRNSWSLKKALFGTYTGCV